LRLPQSEEQSQSEGQFRSYVESVDAGLIITDEQGTISYANPRMTALTGYTLEEMIGKPAHELFMPPEQWSSAQRRNARVVRGHSERYQLELRRKDGSQFWAELNASPLHGEAGQTSGILNAITDITERRRAEGALRNSEEQLRSLIASIDALVFSIDLEGRFLVYHAPPASAGDTLTTPKGIYVGQRYRDILPENLVRQLETVIAQVTKDYHTRHLDYSLTVDGEERFFSARVSPLIGARPSLLGVTVVADDVTEAVRARQRQLRLLGLEQLNRTLTALFLQSDDPDQAVNEALERAGQSLDVCRAYVFHFRENERLLDITHEWCAPGVASNLGKLQGLAFDEILPSFLPLLTRDGVIAPPHIRDLPEDIGRFLADRAVLTALMLPFYVEKRLQGFIGFDEMRRERQWLPEEIAAVRTITQSYSRVLERQRTQLVLIQARDAALRSARLKTEFMSNMSHEIRTPMTSILGMLELLMECSLTDEQREYTQLGYASAKSLLRLLDDILDFSKIEAKSVVLQAVPTNLRGVITEISNMLAPEAARKGLELLTEVADDVPTHVQVDPVRLRQVLTNLTENAIKFTEKGRVCITARRTSSISGHPRLRFEISDTGIGIPASLQTQIFESFVQADGSATRKYGGTGLGLTIVKQLVELMEGEIGVESIVGQGSTFWFGLTLPEAVETGEPRG
jgi:PAS domain S-box-containing protein